jgi:hypothetical protein
MLKLNYEIKGRIRMQSFNRVVSVLLILSLAILAGSCQPYHYEGAAVGGGFGALAGALLDDKNPWRGGVIGAALGAAFGATLADISSRGAQEAVRTGAPVEYRTRTNEGTAVYRAEPKGYDAKTKCNKVQERVWENGKLVKDEIKEICKGKKTEPGYFGEQAEGVYEGEYEERREYPPPPEYERERHEDDYYERGRKGPPPWAPAHGYRAKHRYRYYPDAYVYYNEGMDLYYYRYAGRWVESPLLPSNIYLEDYVVLEMDVEDPHSFHSDVVREYPPGYRQKPRGNWKYY